MSDKSKIKALLDAGKVVAAQAQGDKLREAGKPTEAIHTVVKASSRVRDGKS